MSEPYAGKHREPPWVAPLHAITTDCETRIGDGINFTLSEQRLAEDTLENLAAFWSAHADWLDAHLADTLAVDWSSPDPGRCPSCGHPPDVDCGCSCCPDYEPDHQEVPQ